MQRFSAIPGFRDFLRTLPRQQKAQLKEEIAALGEHATAAAVKRLMQKYKRYAVEKRGKFAKKQKAPHRSTSKRGHELDREVQQQQE